MTTTLSGNMKMEAGGRRFSNKDDSKDNPLTQNQRSAAFFSRSKAAINVTNKVDDLTYGATIRLQVATNQSNGTDKSSRLDRSHIFLDSDFGSVQLGTNVAASKLMQVTASDVASATGGIDGDYSMFLGKGLDGNNQFLFDADTLTNNIDGKTESANKITYLTPRVEGVQFGLSYTPDLSNGGNSVGVANLVDTNPTYNGTANQIGVRNLYSFGLNYKNTFNDVSVEVAATADTGKVKSQVSDTIVTKYHNVKTYNVGTVVGMNGFKAALSYSSDGKSAMQNNGSKGKSAWWTTGVAYENGPMSTSLTYLAGKNKFTESSAITSKTQVLSLGADYEVAPGFKPFTEVTYAKLSETGSKAQKATVFILGTRVKF